MEINIFETIVIWEEPKTGSEILYNILKISTSLRYIVMTEQGSKCLLERMIILKS